MANSMPVSRTLQMMKDIVQGPGYEGDELYNAAAAVEQGERYTAYYDRGGRRSGVCKRARDASTSIDHVLISKTLQDSHVVSALWGACIAARGSRWRPRAGHAHRQRLVPASVRGRRARQRPLACRGRAAQ